MDMQTHLHMYAEQVFELPWELQFQKMEMEKYKQRVYSAHGFRRLFPRIREDTPINLRENETPIYTAHQCLEAILLALPMKDLMYAGPWTSMEWRYVFEHSDKIRDKLVAWKASHQQRKGRQQDFLDSYLFTQDFLWGTMFVRHVPPNPIPSIVLLMWSRRIDQEGNKVAKPVLHTVDGVRYVVRVRFCRSAVWAVTVHERTSGSKRRGEVSCWSECPYEPVIFHWLRRFFGRWEDHAVKLRSGGGWGWNRGFWQGRFGIPRPKGRPWEI